MLVYPKPVSMTSQNIEVITLIPASELFQKKEKLLLSKNQRVYVDGALDSDQDWMPDGQEPALGGTPQNPQDGGPFDPAIHDTDGDGLRDDEDYTIATQPPWTEGAANDEDWADPGMQHATNARAAD